MLIRETYRSEKYSSRANDVRGWDGGGGGVGALRGLEMVDADRVERMLTTPGG